ncbi:unnamed protein product, partial [Amoebophrya sp. A25]|eukprot:GSA25T00020858001.1
MRPSIVLLPLNIQNLMLVLAGLGRVEDYLKSPEAAEYRIEDEELGKAPPGSASLLDVQDLTVLLARSTELSKELDAEVEEQKKKKKYVT